MVTAARTVPRLTPRAVIAIGVAAFASVVSASFLYGFLLLWRGPSSAPANLDGTPAPLPPDVLALLARSGESMKKGEVEQAIRGYRRVLTLGPSLEAQVGLAEGEWRAGRLDEARREYERVLRLDARHPVALHRLAQEYAGRRETWPDAEARYREYLAIAPADAEASLGLARVLAWRGESAAAIELYARPDVQPRMTPEDRRDYAFALARAGRTSQAEPLLQEMARSNPQDAAVAMSLGGLHATRQEWDRALPLYRSALERRPDDPEANLTYGQGLLATKDFRSALVPLERAARGLPGRADAGIAYARALRGAGDLKRADAQFDRVMPLRDADAELEREYADLLTERKDYGKAAAFYRRAEGHGLRDQRLLTGLAGALSANGKPAEALPFLEEAYATGGDRRTGLDLARLHKRLGHNSRALQLLAEIERAPGVP